MLIQHNHRSIVLIGVVHYSKKSLLDVYYLIDSIQPDTVFVELCNARTLILKRLIRRAFLKNKTPLSEMSCAIIQARNNGCVLVSGDKHINDFDFHCMLYGPTALRRGWNYWWRTDCATRHQHSLQLDNQNIIRDPIRAQTRNWTIFFRRYLPETYKELIDDRDQWMFEKLQTCPGPTIVAVVGMAHMDGIQSRFVRIYGNYGPNVAFQKEIHNVIPHYFTQNKRALYL